MEYTADEIKKVLIEDVIESDLVEINNSFCEKERWYNDIIHRMDDFNDVFSGSTPYEIAEMVTKTDFDVNAKYFKEGDTYRDFRSSDDPLDLMPLEDIANYLEREQETFGVTELEDLLESAQEAEAELE